MEQTKYQKAAMDYSKEYLDKLLDLESYVGKKLDGRIDQLIDQKIKQRMKQLVNEPPQQDGFPDEE